VRIHRLTIDKTKLLIGNLRTLHFRFTHDQNHSHSYIRI